MATLAWAALLAFGGGRSSRLGMLTGGAPLMSMSSSGSMAGTAGMPGIATTSPPCTVSSSGSMAGMAGMAAMATTSPAPSTMSSSGAMAGTTHPATAAQHMKMTMLGVTIAGSDGTFSLPVFALFGLMWTVMVGAMMLPVITPMAHRYHIGPDEQSTTGSALTKTARFSLGAVAIWVAASIPAYFLVAALQSAFPIPDATAIRLGGLLIALAGSYEFTAVKRPAHHMSHGDHFRPDDSTSPWKAGWCRGGPASAAVGP